MVRPATKYLCKKGYRMMIGSEVITVAAALIEVGVTVACAFFIVSELAFWLVTELSSFISSYWSVVRSVLILLYSIASNQEFH